MGTLEASLLDKLALFPNFAPHINKLFKVRGASSVADGTAVFSIGELFIVLVAPLPFPNVVAEEVAKIGLAKRRLSHPEKVIDVLLCDRLETGQSFDVLPKGRPLSSNPLVRFWQRHRLIPPALAWLRSLADDAKPSDEEARQEFVRSISALNEVPGLGPEVRDETRLALQSINRGTMHPQFCPMHGDAWIGNFIQLRGSGFVVIDWRSFRPDGYGFFDLVKFCQTAGVTSERFRAELYYHMQRLGTDQAGAVTTLLAACGHVYRNLDQFALPRFIEMTESLLRFFKLHAKG